MITTGTLIDNRYEILRQLGAGGFGSVYKAFQKQFERNVAIKFLNTTLLQEPDGLPRFEREAKAINSLKHKNIISFYGYGVWHQAPYMVMEFVDGTSLEGLLCAEGTLEPKRAAALMMQVFEALECSHRSGVIHRDLKPSNIMVVNAGSANEQVKIIDFGLAKLMPGYGVPGQKLTETGYALGTCHYMAPEQALGNIVDQRADIYGAGCIFYQVLTGKYPFAADTSVGVMFQHLNSVAEPIMSFLPQDDFCSGLAAIVENCMVKDPSDRYQQASEVIAELDEALRGETIKITKRSTSKKHAVKAPSMVAGDARNASKRNIALIAAFTTAFVLGAGVLVMNQMNRDKLNEQYAETSADIYRLSRSRAFQGHLTELDQQRMEHALELTKKDHKLTPNEQFLIVAELVASYAEVAQHGRAREVTTAENNIQRLAGLGDELLNKTQVDAHTGGRLLGTAQYEFYSVMRKYGSTKIAEKVLEKLSEIPQLIPRDAQPDVYSMLALRALQRKQIEYARIYAQEGIEIAKTMNAPVQLATLFVVRGEAESMAGNYQLAESFYHKSIAELDVPITKDVHMISFNANIGLERCALHLHRPAEVHHFAQVAQSDIDTWQPGKKSFDALLLDIAADAERNDINSVRKRSKELIENIDRYTIAATPQSTWQDCNYAYSILTKHGLKKIAVDIENAARTTP